MKKRLLSLLLAMVMIISMVPVQAFAEEADASELLTEPAVVEEVVAEDVPETTEEDVPETTEEIIPETTEEIIPETTEEIIPETTEELIPEETEELIPEETEELAAEEELLVEDVDAEAVVAEADTTDATEYTLTVDAPEAMRAGGRVTFEPVLTVPGTNEGETVKVDGATFTYALKDAEQGKIGIAVKDGELTVDKESFKLTDDAKSVDVVVTVKASIPATEAAPTADGEDAKLKEVATKEVTIKAYAALNVKGIELCVDGKAATAHSLNANDETEKSFTVSVKATDGGPLGKVTWTHPNKSLLTATDNENGTFTYTVNTVKGKVKTGSSSVKASIKEGKKTLKAATSIKVFTAPVNVGDVTIKAPSTVVRAGSKITLTPQFARSFTDKTLEWKVVDYKKYVANTQSSGDTVSNDGAALIEGAEEWDSFVKVDSKGVVTTSANIEDICVATITASPKSNPDLTFKPVEITIQPTLTSFSVKVLDESDNVIDGEASVHAKKFTLKAADFEPEVEACDVTWKISVSSKVAKVIVNKDNTVTVEPKAPGKLTYTATANDGSKVKKSGSVVIGGPADEVTISPVKVKNGKLLPGARVAVSAKATYTIGGKKVTAKGSEIAWTVYEATETSASTETVKIGEKNYTLTATKLASVDAKGYLKAVSTLNKDVTLAVEAKSGNVADYVIVKAGPKNEKTLKLAVAEENAATELIPGVTALKITTKWAVSNGTTADLAANEKPTIKVSNGTYDEKTHTVTAKKAGKVTVTATLGKQTATLTLTAAYPVKSVEITSTKLTVAAGKSLTLKAKAWYNKEKNIPATAQAFTWAITEGGDLATINQQKAVLTAKAVEVGGTVKVTATTANGKVSTPVTVTITAKDKTYVTLNGAVAPATYVLKQDNKFISAEYIGVKVVSENKPTTYPVEKVTLSKGYANWIDEKADETKGTSARKGIEFTGKTGTMALTVTYKVGEATKTVKATMKVVNAVTSIDVTAPATEVAVGTTVKLTAKVNAGEGEFKPSNSKLNWFYKIGEDGEEVSIKDGSLKIAEAATYTVWAEAADGYGAKSDEVKITGLQKASYVIVETDVKDGEGTKKVTANNQTITMYRNEPAVFTAKVTGSDYTTANIAQGVKWTVTGVEYEVDGNKLTLYSDKATTGTVTVTTTDGTKKSASFKVQVSNEVLKTAVAVIGSKGYESLADALAYAKSGDTVKLLKDIDVTETLIVKNTVTLDMNGKKLYNTKDIWNEEKGAWSLISVREKGNLTVTGNGELDAKENDVYAIDLFGKETKCTIENGKFTGNVHAVYVHDGELTVNGGTFDIKQLFSQNQPYDFVLNCLDASYKAGTAKITVNGGKYHNYNPAEAKCESPIADFVPDGKASVKVGDWYEVVDAITEGAASATVSTAGELKTAASMVKAGGTIKLADDITLDETLIVSKNLTLNLNGHNITGNDVRAIQVKAGTLNITGKGTISSKKVDKLVEGSSVIRVGDSDTEAKDAGLVIGKTVTLTSDDTYGVTAFGVAKETVTVNGTITTTAVNAAYDGCAISTSGNDTTAATIVINNGATLSSTKTNAIYMPSGELTVNGGTITGLTGIYVKSGTTTIKGGTINGNMDPAGEYTYYGNGGIPTGDAIVVESCGYPNGAPTLVITAGTINSAKGKAVGIYKYGEVDDAIVNITGGTFAPANVASIGKNYYPTLKDAINACPTGEAANKPTTITLLRDVPNAEGMAVESGKNFIVDFAGHTYTLNKPGAGSKNTETNGFQLLKDSTIVFKNGKIDISEDNLKKASNGQNIKRIIQDYAALTLEDMTIDGTNQFGGASLVMSFNNQPVSIVGKTNIIGAKGLSAFDADGNWGGYAQCVVTVNTTGTIVGDIELGSGKLDIQNAKVDGGINVLTEGYPSHVGRISVSGGSFKSDPTPYLAEGKSVKMNGDWYEVVDAPASK